MGIHFQMGLTVADDKDTGGGHFEGIFGIFGISSCFPTLIYIQSAE
jgi:hypothetical protein